MVSDQEIARGVETLLRQSDPNAVTTLNGVVDQLGARLGLDLSHKAGFIRDQINLLLRSQPQPQPLPPKDHFALQLQHQHLPHPQFQPQFHPHFALQQLQHHQQQLQLQQQQHHLHRQQQHQQQQEELAFRNPTPPQSQPQPQPQPPPTQPRQVQPPPPLKVEPNVQDAAANSSETPKESAPVKAKRKGGPGGLTKVCGVSPELQAVVGEPLLPRTEIVKQLWAYIRKNNLQDPSNKRKIICDDALRLVFETDCTDMFKMNKLLAKHIIRLEPTKEPSQPKRLKVDVEAATESTESGLLPPVMISEALANFFGTGEREMLQSEALRRVWEYIKVNHLEDPLNSMAIICDPKLKELFGCESISALGISEMLARHHLYKQ